MGDLNSFTLKPSIRLSVFEWPFFVASKNKEGVDTTYVDPELSEASVIRNFQISATNQKVLRDAGIFTIEAVQHTIAVYGNHELNETATVNRQLTVQRKVKYEQF